MSIDLRLRHDRSTRERAAEMFERGLGYRSVARVLGVPAEAVRDWLGKYRATGRDGLLAMGGRQARYDFETKVAAASAVVDGGMAKPEAMERFGIASATPLKRWCRLYREGGADALRPKPKGEGRAPDARGGARARGPQARGPGGVPKKIDSPEGGARLAARERAAAVAALSGRFPLADLLTAASLPRSTYYYALSHPKGPTRPELRPRVAEIFGRLPNGAMELRAVDGERVADKTVLKMMREMGLRCGIRRETDYRRYNSYRGVVGETFENVLGRDFAADGPWRKMGTDVTEFKLSFGRAYLAPVYDFGSREIVAHSISLHPDLAQQKEMLAMLAEAKPAWSEPIMQMDMGWQYQHAEFVAALKGMGVVQSMSRKGNCLDNACTEGMFGHLKDEFFRGRDWDDFEEFK
ncbi:IS3 family transposase, partial [Collinsella intestinalis]|uniref:IS3 family transposase n=1 Tax=Collinsella intestinalis TaxID=147207 RepID=UPI0022E32E6C